jgi:hypothetical protein
MPSIKDFKNTDILRVLVYGRSGSGKTFGAGTFPRPVFMDFDKGIATLRNPAFVGKYGVLDIEYEQFTEKSIAKGGVVSQHNAFDDAYVFYQQMMKPDKVGTFDTWVIDTATSLSEIALNKALIFMSGQKLSNTHATAMAQGVVVPKLQDFGAERSLIEQFVAMVLGSGKNVVLLCHEKELYEGENVVGRVPLLTGKGVEAICAQFDEVYNLQPLRKGPDIVRSLVTEQVGRNMAKSRLGIPNGTEWNWPALKGELDKISKAQEIHSTSAVAGAATR